MRFRDRVVLITGGGSNIGRGAALAFAREGARVMVADYEPFFARDTVAALQEITDECAWVRTDVRDEEQVIRMRDKTVRTFGRIDVLVNNAAVGTTSEPIEKVTEQDWDQAFSANVRQMCLCSKYVIPEMIRTGGGAIVNTATIHAVIGQTASLVYGPAKAGILNLTRHIALYYGPQRIRANCVCPGHIRTPRTAEFYDPDPGLIRYYPIGRLGRIDDVVQAYLYLASDEAAFVTGSVFMVDGGYTAH